MNSQSWMIFPQLFPYPAILNISLNQVTESKILPVVNWRGHRFTVSIGDNLNIPQFWHPCNFLNEVIPEVMGRDHQTPEVDKGGCRHHREWNPGDVDDLEIPQGEEADLSNLVKNVLTCKQIHIKM